MASGVTTLNKVRTNEKIPQLYLDSQDAGRKAYVLDLITIDERYYAGFNTDEQTVCLLSDDDLASCYIAGCLFRSINGSGIYYTRPVDMADYRNDTSNPGVEVAIVDMNPTFKVDDKSYSTLTYKNVLGYREGHGGK